MKENYKPSSNISPIKRHIILLLFEKKLKLLWHKKNTTCTTKTIKQIVKNNSKNTKSISNASVYKIRCQNRNKFYMGETSRNLNQRIYRHRKDFKTGYPVGWGCRIQ